MERCVLLAAHKAARRQLGLELADDAVRLPDNRLGEAGDFLLNARLAAAELRDDAVHDSGPCVELRRQSDRVAGRRSCLLLLWRVDEDKDYA